MIRDLQLAIRRFRFRPAHTALMIMILGVGIGAATAVFSVVDQTILRPPPFAHAERLVEVMDRYAGGARSTTLIPEKIAGWQQQPSLFEAFEAYTWRQYDLTGGELEPERIGGLVVSNGLLRMLGIQPSLGRGFADNDGRAGGERVVLISDGLWRRKFAGQTDVLGRGIALNDVQHTIIGVLPRRFRLTGNDENLLLPVDVSATSGDAATPRGFVGIGRLAPGIDSSSQQKLADTLAARMQAQSPLPSDPFWNIHLARKKVAAVAETTQTALFVLLGAVGFVLLITCANTANLFLSNVGIRQREMAIRAAIGAARGRLFREVLTESVALAVCGGAVGILLATWGVDAIVAAAPPNLTFSSTSPIEVDLRILAVAAAATLLTGVVFGLIPALRGSRPNLDVILKSSVGAGMGQPYSRFSAALVVAEVAFSLLLLVGAALMIRTFTNLQAIDPGFEPGGLIAMEVSLPTDKYVGEGYSTRTMIVRAADPAGIVPAMRAAVWTVDRNQPMGRVALVEDMYAEAFARERFVLQLMSVFGAIAVVLTATGIFGVLSQLVARKTREIGVRMALGARSADILRLVLSRGIGPLVIGTALGLGGAAALTRFLEALLFEVRPIDPLSFSVVTILLIAIALAASWLPVRRAIRVDPAVALRVE